MKLLLQAPPTTKNLALLTGIALFIRAIVFIFFVQKVDEVSHKIRFSQPDTPSYHGAALGIACNQGMFRLDNGQPIFWRVPGYPWYLSLFYNWYGLKNLDFDANRPAQTASIWFQIILSSLIPLLIFLLAWQLTKRLWIAWLSAWISVFHIGFVFASSFLLTEGISLPFFMLFLLFFYRSFSTWFEKPISHPLFNTVCAALSLGIFSWFRPMGEFVGVLTIILLLILAQLPWKQKIAQCALFALVLWGTMAPWCYRNYQLTGHWFFSPMFGLYLNSFCAPKIMRDVKNSTFEQEWRTCHEQAGEIVKSEFIKRYYLRDNRYIVQEKLHMNIAWPIIKEHPFLFAYYWCTECFKTLFDLFSSQHLVAFANHSFDWDPLEEFLTEKTANALYKKSIPLSLRIVTYAELCYALLLWIGIIAGTFLFFFSACLRRFKVSAYAQHAALLWIKIFPMIGALCGMTGGFGYARLRLPIEPLIIIASVTFWYWFLFERKKS